METKRSFFGSRKMWLILIFAIAAGLQAAGVPTAVVELARGVAIQHIPDEQPEGLPEFCAGGPCEKP